MHGEQRPRDAERDDLTAWLAEGYAPAFRTALLLVGNRADAEEAVQDAFLRAWRFRAAVPEGDSIRPWLYRVVVNACLSKLRSSGRHVQRNSPFPAEWEDSRRAGDTAVSDPEAQVLDQESRRTVVDALADLPEHLRVVVVLRYYAQLSEREIASVIHRRPGTVKSRLHEGRLRLGRDARLVQMAGTCPRRTEGEAR